MKKEEFYNFSEREVLFKVKSKQGGLGSEQASERLGSHGKNELPEKKPKNAVLVFLGQFRSFLIYILILAAVISYFAGHIIDVYVILGVILINATIGFSQEYRAEKSIRALKKIVVSMAKVYRDGSLKQIPARNLVVGDVIELEEGDKVPADCRLLYIKNFRTVESSLTGESFPSDKVLKVLPSKTALGDRVNMVFMGTFVGSGKARAVVVATGGRTEVGKIAGKLKILEKVQSHFKRKTDTLAKQMAVIAFAGASIVFLVGYFIRNFGFTEIFLFTIASLVSAIPEGLPAVLAIVLAVGAFRMSKKNAIIRTLPATETLGIVDTIITDKTGTLTENTMNVERVILPGYPEIKITGKGWNPEGEFILGGEKINPLDNQQFKKLLSISYLCNNAHVFSEKKGSKIYNIIGDPTEAALIVLAKKSGLKKIEEKLDDLPFTPELKYRASLSVLIKQKEKKQIYVVGSPEAVLGRSRYFLNKNTKKKMTEKDRNKFFSDIENLTNESMRVLALAYKDTSKNSLDEKDAKELIFVGVVGIRDPPREEVKGAIKKARNAGIRIIMVTGDHKGTAVAVAKEIGLVSGDYKAFTGNELEALSDSEFSNAVKGVDIFARLTPEMKMKIAGELQKQGHVIAMTGDGVNDAPALKMADIGVSMGVMGTDVARESSEMVLADDNFASIVNAIEEGRIVFTNTRQASGFLVTTNFAEHVTILSTLFAGMPLPLLPAQILYLNLVTDGVTDVSLAMEPGHHDVLNEKPRNSKENILNKEILPFLILMAGIMTVLTFFVFRYYLSIGLEEARTGAFVVMSFTQLFNALNMRSWRKSFFKIGFFSNKFLSVALVVSVISIISAIYLPFFQRIFGFSSLGFLEVFIMILLSSLVFVGGEVYKFARAKVKR